MCTYSSCFGPSFYLFTHESLKEVMHYALGWADCSAAYPNSGIPSMRNGLLGEMPTTLIEQSLMLLKNARSTMHLQSANDGCSCSTRASL